MAGRASFSASDLATNAPKHKERRFSQNKEPSDSGELASPFFFFVTFMC